MTHQLFFHPALIGAEDGLNERRDRIGTLTREAAELLRLVASRLAKGFGKEAENRDGYVFLACWIGVIVGFWSAVT